MNEEDAEALESEGLTSPPETPTTEGKLDFPLRWLVAVPSNLTIVAAIL